MPGFEANPSAIGPSEGGRLWRRTFSISLCDRKGSGEEESRRPEPEYFFNKVVAFIKNKEDFICEHCGKSVKGTGFTNHCPSCLWSKHVDINPGDRGATCGGLMRPIRIEGTQRRYLITHKCEICGYQKRNRVEVNDNFDEVIKIVKNTK